MPVTYQLISSNVLSSSAASVTFSSIPATYTDLVVRMSTRNDQASVFGGILYELNGDTSTTYSTTFVRGSGSAILSDRRSGTPNNAAYFLLSTGNNATASTFGSSEAYFPNYAGSNYKVASAFTVSENNATTAYAGATANLYSASTAITSIKILSESGNFVSGSSFYLYGIKNS
jgi:hypothetical protein